MHHLTHHFHACKNGVPCYPVRLTSESRFLCVARLLLRRRKAYWERVNNGKFSLTFVREEVHTYRNGRLVDDNNKQTTTTKTT